MKAGTRYLIILLAMLAGLGVLATHDEFVRPAAGQPPAAKSASDISEKLQHAMPAVVNISTTRKIDLSDRAVGAPGEGVPDDSRLRDFFGDLLREWGLPPELRERSLGSGVIVDPSGYIVTNYHVIAQAERITVLLADGRELEAKAIGADPKTDIAAIKIEAKDLPTLEWGDSDKLRVGDQVYAIGSPFGLNRTVTGGIVSAVGRADVGIADYEDFIQTDAAINPGNSGGALIDADGKLMGISTAIFSQTGGYMGIGFAVPSKMARQAMQSLVKNGRVIRGYLGVGIQQLTPALARQFGLKEPRGVVVTQVMSGSPADRAGIKTGDVILTYQGQDIESPGDLRNRVAATPIDHKADLSVVRDGKGLSPEVQVAEQPREPVEATGKPQSGTETNRDKLGLEVADLTDEIRRQLNLAPDTHGVVVSGVAPGAAAAEAGLRPGDVIVEVNRREVENVEELRQHLDKTGRKQDLLFLVTREGARHYVVVERG